MERKSNSKPSDHPAVVKSRSGNFCRKGFGSVDVSFAAAPGLFLREARPRPLPAGLRHSPHPWGSHEEGSLVVPNERRIMPHRAKTGPAGRVARQMSPCGVAGIAKGTTITCIPRLAERRPAWRHLAQQRG